MRQRLRKIRTCLEVLAMAPVLIAVAWIWPPDGDEDLLERDIIE
jgi:hypothetical protein